MGAKFIGIQRVSGEKGKKSGKPYDFCECTVITDSNRKVHGYEAVSFSVDTEDLLAENGCTFEQLIDGLNGDCELISGLKFGKPAFVGFRLI